MKRIISFILMFVFILPTNLASASNLQILCPGGGSYSLVLPSGVASLGQSCTGSLVIDERVKIIAKDAFSFSQLSAVFIPDSVTEIGVSAFSNSNLENLQIGRSLEIIPFNAFSSNKLKSVIIPSNVRIIGGRAFRDNPLESVLIGEGVVGIDFEAFMRTKLVDLVIPDSVEQMGYSAFAYIPTLKFVVLSENFEQFRNSDNALWVGDVFEGSIGISKIIYCGKMIGFSVTPVCEGPKKDAIIRAAAEIKAKQEAEAKAAAEIKAKQEAEALAAKLRESQEREELAKQLAVINFKFKTMSAKYPHSQLADFKNTIVRLNLAWSGGLESWGFAGFEQALTQINSKMSDFEAKNPLKTTITCVKGKLVKKVTGVKPKCPSGYKAKK